MRDLIFAAKYGWHTFVRTYLLRRWARQRAAQLTDPFKE